MILKTNPPLFTAELKALFFSFLKEHTSKHATKSYSSSFGCELESCDPFGLSFSISTMCQGKASILLYFCKKHIRMPRTLIGTFYHFKSKKNWNFSERITILGLYPRNVQSPAVHGISGITYHKETSSGALIGKMA